MAQNHKTELINRRSYDTRRLLQGAAGRLLDADDVVSDHVESDHVASDHVGVDLELLKNPLVNQVNWRMCIDMVRF